ncbi:uncharacterized protein CC84DRAFT_1167573 [Paraphaeosphaeria sporulosa]|uniref:RNA-dependent RNA polymerase n=1 Tax=Paraphaeosphaeria sporulosa TaxID=1460663 RepID=A0A177C3I3_9PLEO|nr:uncharacterized protein CC84DRAFT_1167573 [Paraphaeosphaeria sporulosa]OAG01337.1 hypothetical protein CC84DRAFT_1167573 [Paraphaeosphaeria sporulosa]
MASNRPPPSQGNRGKSAGLAPPAPSTPSKSGKELYALIDSFNEQWKLGLVRDPDWTPTKSTKDVPETVYNHLKRLYWQGDFHDVVGRFVLQAPSLSGTAQVVRTKRLGLLCDIVRDVDVAKGRSPGSRAGTPVGGSNLIPGLRALRMDQSSTSKSRPSAASSRHYTSYTSNGESHGAFFDPGSPTDEDEPPPSPIASSKSAQRRIQASPRYQMGASARKRPSDSSGSDYGNSPKLTRTSKGKQPANNASDSTPPVFKKPWLPESFTGVPNHGSSSRSAQPEVVDSFASTVENSFHTTSSSQQTLVDTPGTSFASDAYDADVRYPKLTRTSSTSLGSLKDQDLFDIEDPSEAQIQREQRVRMEELNYSHSSQDPPPHSSSAYGSVDEEVMWEKSFEVDTEEYDSPAVARQSLSRLPSASSSGKRPLGSKRLPKPSAESSPFNRPSPHDDHSERSLKPSVFDRSKQLGHKVSGNSPARASFNKSPSKLPHYIRNIPDQNFFNEPLTGDLKEFPYFVLFICSKLASEHSIPLPTLLQGVNARRAFADPSKFLEQVCEKLSLPRDALRDQQKYWSAWKRDFEGYTFKARIDYNDLKFKVSSNPVFKMILLPIQADRSCRLQRKFGSDRFLYVNVPSFDLTSSRHTKDDLKNIEHQFKLWCGRNHSFLGRTWRAFHVEPIKKKKGRVTDDLSAQRIVLFAIEGIGIEKPTIAGNMIDWFFPFEENKDQIYPKAFARLDLGLSRTIPSLTFKPHQVIYVEDILADSTPENLDFNDNRIGPWPNDHNVQKRRDGDHIIQKSRDYPKNAVMNDGCSLISVGAALLIWQEVRKITNSDEPMPSAFQARVGGAKGVWMISAEPSSATDDDRKIWIKVSKSQLKFEPRGEDRSDELESDPLHLTFEYVNHSRRPVPSELHISFVPILVDRGVPSSVIADLMEKQLDSKRDELIQLLLDTERMYHWVHQEGPSNTGFESPPWQGAMYQSLPEKIKHLLESGFTPAQEPYLADCLYRFIQNRQLWMESKLRVPLSKSTFVLGVADPFGILEPGEVHMEFSTPFTDELTGGRLRSLENIEILVSRQPACRRSDIQKARTVRHPELSHLIDVVVFSTKGQYPLAGKLQGGDYDGDIFWLCWDQAIVQPFKNAPAPVGPPDPVQYGIQQDIRKLHQVMDSTDLSTVNNFLAEAFEFRMAPSMLGVVTSHLEKMAYHENQVFSNRLDALCDMHDLLVDAPKQGYKFTKKDFHHQTINVLRCDAPRKPAYKEAMEDCEKKDDTDKTRNKDYKPKNENILDYLYFEVIRKHDVATLKQVKDLFPKEFGEDPDAVLQYPYLQLCKHVSPEVQKELKDLLEKLELVDRKWRELFHDPKKEEKLDWYSRAVETCFTKYRAILPTQVDHPDIKPWVHPFSRPQYSVWEEIRASALYTKFTKRRPKLVWAVAGKELAELKAASCAGSTRVVPNIKAIMKPRAPKAPKLEDSESEDEFEDAVEEL